LDHGGFLALTVARSYLGQVEQELARRFDVAPIPLDRLLLRNLQSVAAANSVRWEAVLGADAGGPQGRHWGRLQQMLAEALAGMEDEVRGAGPAVLVTRVGLLKRYGALDWLERLRDRTGAADWPVRTLWVLLPAASLDDRPAVDGVPLPVLSANQWARVPLDWIQNRHRGEDAA
jgi:hypothetical protein